MLTYGFCRLVGKIQFATLRAPHLHVCRLYQNSRIQEILSTLRALPLTIVLTQIALIVVISIVPQISVKLAVSKVTKNTRFLKAASWNKKILRIKKWNNKGRTSTIMRISLRATMILEVEM